MKKGLVLEGGGMRGLFTAGVTDFLMEQDIEFDGMVGVSAGAAFGCNVKSRQIGRALRYNIAYCRDKRYCSIRSLIKTGDLFGKDFCYNVLPNKLDVFDKQAFGDNSMEFHIVTTDLETGKAVYKVYSEMDEKCLEWICASASLPLVSNIVKIDGRLLLDGGVADSIPLKYFEGLGYDKNLVVLTQPKGYVKKKNSALPIIKLVYRNYPKFVLANAIRHEMYNHTTKYIEEKEAAGQVFVIRPDEALCLDRIEHNPDKLRRAYNHGRRVAERELEKLIKFLDK